MHGYSIYAFQERLKCIEQFFIEIASNEEELRVFGFDRAVHFQNAEAALKALDKFDEDFASLKRFMTRFDRAMGQDLERLDSDGRLIEQVALIALHLRMAGARKPINKLLSFVNQLSLYLPFVSKRKKLFGEEPISLHKTIISLGRLRGMATICWEIFSNREISDNEVFKPSNVKNDRILDLIDGAFSEIESLVSISPAERVRIEWYLQEAKKEILSPTPAWSKIVGALVIAAAITSGLADAPNAAKNIKDAIEYILGTSVEKPLQKYLPSPSESEKSQTPVGTLV